MIVRKPNIKSRIKARTTGKIKRNIKKSVNPFYGKKGIGFAKKPQASINDAIYYRTTIGIGSSEGNSQSRKKATQSDSVTGIGSQVTNQKGFSFLDMVVTIGSGFFRIVIGIIGLIFSIYLLCTDHLFFFVFLFAITCSILLTGLLDFYKYVKNNR